MPAWRVVLKDVSKPIAERTGRLRARKLNADGGRQKQPDMREMLLSRIHTTESSGLRKLRPGHRSVFEKPPGQNRGPGKPKSTSTNIPLYSKYWFIPITQLAEASVRPQTCTVVFPSCRRPPLVEIVRGERLQRRQLPVLSDFVGRSARRRSLSQKTMGAYAARVQNTFILEGITMLRGGPIRPP